MLFGHFANIYPWTAFKEDNISLEGILTAVGIILPSKFDTKEDREYLVQRDNHGLPIDVLDASIAEILLKSRPVV